MVMPRDTHKLNLLVAAAKMTVQMTAPRQQNLLEKEGLQLQQLVDNLKQLCWSVTVAVFQGLLGRTFLRKVKLILLKAVPLRAHYGSWKASGITTITQ